MNPFFNMMNNPIINVMRQVQQIKQNPNQLAGFLRQRGMINEQQAKEIQKKTEFTFSSLLVSVLTP